MYISNNNVQIISTEVYISNIVQNNKYQSVYFKYYSNNKY